VRHEIAAGEHDAARLLVAVRQVIDSEPAVTLDYAEIVDADSWEPVLHLRKPSYVAIAARVGGTHLIDNALIEPTGESFMVTV
jgi:pantothenate synthetase